jgi:hypothetical protein
MIILETFIVVIVNLGDYGLAKEIESTFASRQSIAGTRFLISNVIIFCIDSLFIFQYFYL